MLQDPKTNVSRRTSTPEWQSGYRHQQHKPGEDHCQDPELPLLCTIATAKAPPKKATYKQHSNFPPQNPPARTMTSPKPNLVNTMSYDGLHGDREFVVACKSRPFSILTSPSFPTPAFTMVDHSLIRELNLQMTNLQCSKMTYGGQKLRILGKISTSVQCIVDGKPAGNLHFKASVVQDVYKLFDTHSIAGIKLSQKLIGPPYQLSSDTTSSTEPTKNTNTQARPRKKRKKSIPPFNSEASSSSHGTDSDISSPDRGNKSSEESSSESDTEMTFGEHLVARLAAQRALPIEEVTINPTHQAILDKSVNPTLSHASSVALNADEYTDIYTNVSTVQTYSVAKPGLTNASRLAQHGMTIATVSTSQSGQCFSNATDGVTPHDDENEYEDPDYRDCTSEAWAWRNSPYY